MLVGDNLVTLIQQNARYITKFDAPLCSSRSTSLQTSMHNKSYI